MRSFGRFLSRKSQVMDTRSLSVSEETLPVRLACDLARGLQAPQEDSKSAIRASASFGSEKMLFLGEGEI